VRALGNAMGRLTDDSRGCQGAASASINFRDVDRKVFQSGVCGTYGKPRGGGEVYFSIIVPEKLRGTGQFSAFATSGKTASLGQRCLCFPYILIEARIVKEDRVRPRIIVEYVVSVNIEPTWEDAFLGNLSGREQQTASNEHHVFLPTPRLESFMGNTHAHANSLLVSPHAGAHLQQVINMHARPFLSVRTIRRFHSIKQDGKKKKKKRKESNRKDEGRRKKKGCSARLLHRKRAGICETGRLPGKSVSHQAYSAACSPSSLRRARPCGDQAATSGSGRGR